jgi:MYXO-CTERM domain-containing protein
MTDERADRLQRLKVLVAVTALAVLLLAWRRRRRH